jgi:hypothetical protein
MKIYSNSKDFKEIDSLDKWLKLCSPKGGLKQWKDGFSAKEMAKFWLDEKKSKDFQKFVQKIFPDFDYIIPEYKSCFDNYKSPRKHDLFIAEKNNKAIITIEGKVNEPFGNSFEKEFIANIAEKANEPKSKKMDRMINLYLNYFQSNSDILKIKYQLLCWFAGSLTDAIKKVTDNFIMILQEFTNNKTNSQNHSDFEEFLKLISEGKPKQIKNKQIIGPIKNKYTKGKNLYIGYYSTNL